ncbi:MAG: acyl-CoA mutase large subunit family protein, partial [Thermodesulfobacteriota bacterium]
MVEKKRTTKQILHEALENKKRTPLYHPDVLEKLRQELDRWMSTVVREENRKDWHSTPHTILGSDIPREMLYTPLSNPDFDYM